MDTLKRLKIRYTNDFCEDRFDINLPCRFVQLDAQAIIFLCILASIGVWKINDEVCYKHVAKTKSVPIAGGHIIIYTPFSMRPAK